MRSTLVVLVALALTSCKSKTGTNNLSAIEFRDAKFYQLKISASDQNNNRMRDIVNALNDWRCNSTLYSTYEEVVRDFRGKEKRLPKTSNSSYSFNPLVFGQQPGQLNIKIDNLSLDPKVGIEIVQRCSRDTIEMQQVYDSHENKWEVQPKQVTETMRLTWACNIDVEQLKQSAKNTVKQSAKNTVKKFDCTAEYQPSMYNLGFLTAIIQDPIYIKIEASLTSESRNLSFDNCSTAPHNPFLIRLEQGVGGWWGENDFVFTVNLDGQDLVKFNSESGLISEDILYCPSHDKDTVSMKVSVIEDDLFFVSEELD